MGELEEAEPPGPPGGGGPALGRRQRGTGSPRAAGARELPVALIVALVALFRATAVPAAQSQPSSSERRVGAAATAPVPLTSVAVAVPPGPRLEAARDAIARTFAAPCDGGFTQSIQLASPVDLSGTWARKPLFGFCEALYAPPSLLELELVASSETEDGDTGETTFELTYQGSFTNYSSFVRRSDCPPMEGGLAGAKCTNPGPGKCFLLGSRYTVNATLKYVLTPGYQGDFGPVPPALGYCFDPVIEFESVAPGAEPDIQTPGSATWGYYPGQAGACGFWGERCSEGLAESIGVTETEHDIVFGSTSICTACAIDSSSPEMVPLPLDRSPFFYPVERTPQQLKIEETIAGQLSSNVPTDTDTGFDDVVETASVGIHLQKGRITPQGMGESDGDFEARVLAQLEGERDSISLRREGDGSFATGAPGLFESRPLSVFRLGNRAGKSVWEPALYTVVVRNAQTEELERSPPVTGDPTGGTMTLLFADEVAVNVVPGSAPLDIGLDALTGLGTKKRIVGSVKDACPVNYTTPEDTVQAYLDDLMDGTIPTTPERDEGLRRAVWSEIAVRDMARYAGQLLPLAMDSFATIIAELFDDFVAFESAGVAHSKKVVQMLDAGTLPASYKTGFKIDLAGPPGSRYVDALSQAQMLGRSAMLASQIKKLLKTVRLLIVDALSLLGVDQSDASTVAGAVEQQLKLILTVVQNGSVARGTKPVIKDLIKAAVQSGAGELLDGAVPFSYCALTSPLLDDSYTAMTGWSSKNQPDYVADRTAVTSILAEAGDESSALVWDVLRLQWYGELADLTEDVFAFIGKGLKSAEVVSKLAKGVKYGTNVAAFVTPMVYVFSELRAAADDASHRAFDLPPSGATGAGGGAAVAAAPRAAATVAGVLPRTFAAGAPPSVSGLVSPLQSALSSLVGALSSDDFGAVDAAMWESDPGGFRVELESFLTAARGFDVAAQGLDTASAEANLLALLAEIPELVNDFDTQAQQAFDGVNELLIRVWTEAFSGPTDPSYLVERNLAIDRLDLLATRASELAGRLDTFANTATTAGVGFLPAIAVSAIEVESTTTQSHLVSLTPETLTVTAHVHNPSAGAVTGATARLTVVSPKSSTALVGGADVALSALSANDGTPGSGSDETTAQWQIEYSGDLSDELILLTVELLEGSAEPTSFVGADGDRFTAVDPELGNSDLDLLPDDWETAHGLDLGSDDSGADPDGDLLPNYAELRYGTLPEDPDSDDDGLTDGEEIGGGVSATATDPLDADTDDDGVPDGSDSDPLDPGVSAEVSPALATRAALPPAGEPVVMLDKTQVTLSADHPFTLVHVSNAGGGFLEWAVDVESDAGDGVIVTTPPEGVASAGMTLVVGTAAGYDYGAGGSLHATLRVRDLGGAVMDEVAIEVGTGQSDACGGSSYDIDDNDSVAPLTDGLLTLRRLFGFGGSILATGAVGGGALRGDAADIAAFVDCIGPTHLDPDGDGATQALTDGLLLLRYLFGFRGVALVSGAVGAGCTRCTAGEIESYFAARLP